MSAVLGEALQGFAAEALDLGPVAAVDHGLGQHPGAADAHHVGYRQVVGEIVQADASGGAEADIGNGPENAFSAAGPPLTSAGNSLKRR